MDTCRSEGKWWMSVLCMSHHLSHSLCSFSLFNNVLGGGRKLQESKRVTRLVCLLSSMGQMPKCWLFFSSGGGFVHPSENLLHPVGCYVFSDIWAVSLWFLPGSLNNHPMQPASCSSSLVSVISILVNPFKRLLLHLPHDFEKLSASSVLNSGGTCLFLHSVPLPVNAR